MKQCHFGSGINVCVLRTQRSGAATLQRSRAVGMGVVGQGLSVAVSGTDLIKPVVRADVASANAEHPDRPARSLGIAANNSTLTC